jgi:hypothetical protein
MKFKKKESFKHECAKDVLAKWVDGVTEEIFYIEESYLFIPDVTVRINNKLIAVYEVVNAHAFTGKKLGLMQEWCYRNATDLSVFEISADYILAQTEIPNPIIPMEYYNIEILD